MRNNEYLDRNAKGYEGDENIHLEISKLVEKFTIESIIETGTFHGATSKRLSEFAPVITIEANKENWSISRKNLQSFENINLLLGSSENVLSELKITDKTLLFLDAHWTEDCPLIDELKIIAEKKAKPVIIIHDFKVPERDELGFDSYNGQDFTFEWIQPHIENIYGIGGYSYRYNDKAEGAMRGVIYIYPN